MPQKYQVNGIHGFISLKIRIENNHDLKKYDWQKPHQSNQTGTENAYHPNQNNEQIKKKYTSWKS